MGEYVITKNLYVPMTDPDDECEEVCRHCRRSVSYHCQTPEGDLFCIRYVAEESEK